MVKTISECVKEFAKAIMDNDEVKQAIIKIELFNGASSEHILSKPFASSHKTQNKQGEK